MQDMRRGTCRCREARDDWYCTVRLKDALEPFGKDSTKVLFEEAFNVGNTIRQTTMDYL